MRRSPHRFGGSWTEDKLNRLSRYLRAYTTALKKQRFRLLYVDAFAGTGTVQCGRILKRADFFRNPKVRNWKALLASRSKSTRPSTSTYSSRRIRRSFVNFPF